MQAPGQEGHLQPGLAAQHGAGDAIRYIQRGLGQDRHGPLGQGLGHEGGAISLLAPQGQKSPPGAHLAAVAGEVQHLDVGARSPVGETFDECVQVHGLPALIFTTAPASSAVPGSGLWASTRMAC